LGYAYGMGDAAGVYNGGGRYSGHQTVVNIFFGFWLLEIPLAYFLGAAGLGGKAKGAYVSIVGGGMRDCFLAGIFVCFREGGSGRGGRFEGIVAVGKARFLNGCDLAPVPPLRSGKKKRRCYGRDDGRRKGNLRGRGEPRPLQKERVKQEGGVKPTLLIWWRLLVIR